MSTALYFDFRLGPEKALAGHIGWTPAEPFGLLRFQVLAFDHDGHLVLLHASILNLGLEVAILPPDEPEEEDDALLGL